MPTLFDSMPGGDPDGPVVAHIPHSSDALTPEARSCFVIDEATLREEIVRMTDWHTDDLFNWVEELGGSRLISRVSRLVFDPERFSEDELEPMSQRGQGVVYTRTSLGGELAVIGRQERDRRVREYYGPYHAALENLVERSLKLFDKCLILDCHSFSTTPLPAEPDQSPGRPDICVGTDSFHTPGWLVRRLVSGFEQQGFGVKVNSPFAGALVPPKYYMRDDRVAAAMVEVRRGLYCDERSGHKLPGFEDVKRRVRAGCMGALVAWEGSTR